MSAECPVKVDFKSLNTFHIIFKIVGDPAMAALVQALPFYIVTLLCPLDLICDPALSPHLRFLMETTSSFSNGY